MLILTGVERGQDLGGSVLAHFDHVSLAAQLPNYASLLHIEAKMHNSGIMSREKRIMLPSSNYVSLKAKN